MGTVEVAENEKRAFGYQTFAEGCKLWQFPIFLSWSPVAVEQFQRMASEVCTSGYVLAGWGVNMGYIELDSGWDGIRSTGLVVVFIRVARASFILIHPLFSRFCFNDNTKKQTKSLQKKEWKETENERKVKKKKRKNYEICWNVSS